MIDAERVINRSLILEAVEVCQGLIGGRIRTPYQPTSLQAVLDVAIDCPEKPEGFKLDVGPIQGSQLLDQICLVSGGADSTIAWYLLGKPKGLYIDIGQKYSYKEVECLHDNNIDHINIDLSDKKLTENSWKHIIPGRNFLFLTIAAEFVKDNGLIIFSVVDGEGFKSCKGDKSEYFINRWLDWYYAVTGKSMRVETLDTKTKAGWLRAFINNGNDINIIRKNTITCFSEESGQCGKCQACLRKYLSFITNGLDIYIDFNVHPMVGAKEYVNKYKDVLSKALKLNDYSHYSLARCTEDLAAIEKAGILVKLKVMKVK